MTPTLVGRWQSRILLFATGGVLISLILGLAWGNSIKLLIILGYVLVFGLVWDIPYTWMTNLRWDRDWPPALILLTGVWEALFFWWAAHNIGLPGVKTPVDLEHFIIHYWLVWLFVFIGLQGPLRVIFPRWRFRGGRWL
jgi:hypothetical protein